MKVSLQDLIECMEHEGEYLEHYYNKTTEIIIYIEDERTSSYSAKDINEIDKFEDWEAELIIILNDFQNNKDNYIKLPSIIEMDQYNLMVDFCNTLENNSIKEKLSEIDFKDLPMLRTLLEENNLVNDWYNYRESTEKAIAIQWCRDNNINYF